MKKLSVLILTALLIGIFCPCSAGVFTAQKAKIVQNRIYKNTISELKSVMAEQTKQANKHCLKALQEMYSKDFINSDGFGYDVYMKLIEDTWETYPDISYHTEINNVEFDENYASVYVTETAVAAPKDKIGEYEVIGELYSVSECIYFLEKHGTKWLVSSEKILKETSTLKYGDARFINIKLNVPKQIGAGQYYTASLTVDAPKDNVVIASINKANIVYPQEKADENFRKLSDNNSLERVLLSNKDNLNEYAAASIGVTHAETGTTPEDLKVYMNGLAFIMARINVVPENKFVKQIEDKK